MCWSWPRSPWDEALSDGARAIADQATTIRAPVHMIEAINKLNRASRTHLQEFGVEPDIQTLAHKLELPVSKVQQIMKIAKEPVSLEVPVGDEGDTTEASKLLGEASSVYRRPVAALLGALARLNEEGDSSRLIGRRNLTADVLSRRRQPQSAAAPLQPIEAHVLVDVPLRDLAGATAVQRGGRDWQRRSQYLAADCEGGGLGHGSPF